MRLYNWPRPVVHETFEREPITGVVVDGSFTVNINQGVAQQITVHGNANIIEKLKMEVVDGVLYLRLENGNYVRYKLDIDLTVVHLDMVTLNGSGDLNLGTFAGMNSLDLKLDGSGDITSLGVLEVVGKATIDLEGSGDIALKLKAAEVESSLEGSGDIRLEGSTTKMSARLDGSGDIKAFGLESLECKATLEGSGSIRVHASKKLVAELEGSGDIKYRGKPRVEANLDGSGSLSAD